MRRLGLVALVAAFVATVWLANVLVERFGVVTVWPTSLRAPAGVYVIGAAFLLRDAIQRLIGWRVAVAAIAAGCVLSLLVSATLAEASAAAFVASEVAGLVVFRMFRGNVAGPGGLAVAVVAASCVAAAIDSAVFLRIAFGSLAFFEGQVVAKVAMVVLALPFVIVSRRVVRGG